MLWLLSAQQPWAVQPKYTGLADGAADGAAEADDGTREDDTEIEELNDRLVADEERREEDWAMAEGSRVAEARTVDDADEAMELLPVSEMVEEAEGRAEDVTTAPS
jgi:hypothetical protein